MSGNSTKRRQGFTRSPPNGCLMRRASSIACVVALLSGCGGRSNSLPTNIGEADGALTITIRVPHKHRRPDYISAGTKSMKLAISGPTTISETIALTPAAPGCTTSEGTTTCITSVKLAPGGYTATIDTYDGSARLLAAIANAPFTIKAGVANSIHVTLGGVVASLTVGGVPAMSFGTPLAAQAFSVVAKDPDGYVIVGPYNNVVTLATSNAALTVTGNLSSSSDIPTVSYTGAAILPSTISASASGAIAGSALISPAKEVFVTLDTDS